MTELGARAGDAEQDLDLVVAEVEQAADRVVALTPGAHVDLRLDPDLARQYFAVQGSGRPQHMAARGAERASRAEIHPRQPPGQRTDLQHREQVLDRLATFLLTGGPFRAVDPSAT